MLFLANFFSSFRGNRIVVRHDVGFLDAAIKLVGLTTPCFAARAGFIFFAWPLCGVILGVFFEYFTLLGGVSGAMQQACFYAPVILSLVENIVLYCTFQSGPYWGW